VRQFPCHPCVQAGCALWLLLSRRRLLGLLFVLVGDAAEQFARLVAGEPLGFRGLDDERRLGRRLVLGGLASAPEDNQDNNQEEERGRAADDADGGRA